MMSHLNGTSSTGGALYAGEAIFQIWKIPLSISKKLSKKFIFSSLCTLHKNYCSSRMYSIIKSGWNLNTYYGPKSKFYHQSWSESDKCDWTCKNRLCGLLNLTTFLTFDWYNFLFQYDTATKFFRFVNLFGITTLLTESKHYISVLRHVPSYILAHIPYFRRPGHKELQEMKNCKKNWFFVTATHLTIRTSKMKKIGM